MFVAAVTDDDPSIVVVSNMKPRGVHLRSKRDVMSSRLIFASNISTLIQLHTYTDLKFCLLRVRDEGRRDVVTFYNGEELISSLIFVACLRRREPQILCE